LAKLNKFKSKIFPEKKIGSHRENIDFYKMTQMRHRHFGSSMNKNGRLKFISPANNF
jgi:hypothetical protein